MGLGATSKQGAGTPLVLKVRGRGVVSELRTGCGSGAWLGEGGGGRGGRQSHQQAGSWVNKWPDLSGFSLTESSQRTWEKPLVNSREHRGGWKGKSR